MAAQAKHRQSSWSAFATDVLAGIVSLVLIFAFAMAMGGFSFFEPWLIVTPVVMFLTGILLGGSLGNIWIKAIATCIPGWLLVIVTAGGDTKVRSAQGKFGGMLMFAAPAVLGIWLRRRRTTGAEIKADIKN